MGCSNKKGEKIQIFEDLIPLERPIQIMEIGAAAINEDPVYSKLIEAGFAHLHAFEGDPRQIEGIRKKYGDNVTIYKDFIFDGTIKSFYQASTASGMSSLYRPNPHALAFFNGFPEFGKVYSVEDVQTVRLDDVEMLEDLDFIKLDIQGAELVSLQNGQEKLKNALAVQLEVSYIPLYEDQPTFGEVDIWMRAQGFMPHCFLAIKNWSISPTIFGGSFRVAGNQLLESDIVYVRNPMKLNELSVEELIRFAWLTHYCFKSIDLCAHILGELIKRGKLDLSVQSKYYEAVR